jgi:hypothetical protein
MLKKNNVLFSDICISSSQNLYLLYPLLFFMFLIYIQFIIYFKIYIIYCYNTKRKKSLYILIIMLGKLLHTLK